MLFEINDVWLNKSKHIKQMDANGFNFVIQI
jgi:hypothetical protein